MARILLVDDDGLFLEMTKDFLEKYSKEFYTSDWELRLTLCSSAISALEVVNEHAFELIITDIMMAKMDGWEFIKEIRKRYPQFEVPIVVVSAVKTVDLEYDGMRNGASAWFYKPLHPKEFSKEIFKLINTR